MNHRKIFFGLLLCILLPACSSSDSNGELNNLKKHHHTWQKRGISNYQFDISIACFCPQGLSPATIIVRNDTVTSVLNPKTGKVLRVPNSNKPVPEQLPDYYPTVKKLFDNIRNAIEKDYYRLSVKYNTDYGYPERIDLEHSKQISDDAITYIVTNFKSAKSPKWPKDQHHKPKHDA